VGAMTRSTAFLTLATLLSSGCQECLGVPGLSSAECEQLAAMRLPDSPPPAQGNAVADVQDAALLGHDLFFDARLSSNQDVRCATCHIPERYFADGLPTSIGLEKVTRNSPSLYGAAWHRWQTWDGKADSVWSQALLAFENEKEMNFTRLELAHRIALTYRARYEAIFGALPPLSDAQRFPSRGKPGDLSFDGMTAGDQLAVNRVAANVGKSLEAYQRRLAFKPGRFEKFLAGDATALTAEEREGARVFFAAGCDGCHSGPLFSDDDFHAISSAPAERARAEALEVLARSPFNAAGPFHDGAPGEVPGATAQDEGAYRTPSLRNVNRTGPWGHDGAFATLESVVDFHLPSSVTAAERASLVAFLRALNASDPPSPWNNWPGR
jgi:cytochrome c peroxidase